MTGAAAAMLGMEVRTRYRQLWGTAAERAWSVQAVELPLHILVLHETFISL